MKNKNLIYTLCILASMIAPIVVSTAKAASTRPATKNVNVYWIHGLYEDALFWKDFCEEVTPDNGTCLEYDSDHPGGAAGIAAELNKLISNEKEAVLIGHSAGGLIARSIMQMNSNVTAVITVGTPNKGAGIVASVRSEGYMSIVNQILNKTNSALDNAESALNEAQQFLFLQWSEVIRNFINEAAYVRVLNKMIDDFDRSTISKWVDENYNSPLFYDMDTNSTYLRTLNSYPLRSGQKLYCIDGQEDKGQLYRLLGTAANMDKIKGSGSRATYDTELTQSGGAVYELLAYIQEGIDICYMGHDEIEKRWTWGHIGRASDLLVSAAHDLEYLRDYLDTYIHSDWSDEIGAYHYERQLVTIPTIGGSGGLISGGTDSGNNGGYNSGNGGGTNVEVGVEYTQEWRTIKVSDPHDGLIGLATSSTRDTDGYRTDVAGVNHMEMGSHQTMLDAIKEIYDKYVTNLPSIINDSTIWVLP